ncbi:MAG: MBL fold metallo-hydrolase [Bacteroidia bacterium]
MYVEQIYTGCLAQASYYIESNGEAAVIDPIREPEPYLRLAEKRGAKIKFVFETHFHADFVSGHLDLADKTNAVIVFGPFAFPAYPAYIANHNEPFMVGKCTIKLLHTPGHTIESSCFLLLDEIGKEKAVFTGDTLFVGDVGRPDLMSGNKSKTELASMLFDSLNDVIKKLPDDVLVYPGHGAGSACGKNLGIERYSTIGEQKKLNYALQPIDRNDFIIAVTENPATPPIYFFRDASINIIGYRNLDVVISENYKGLTINDFQNEINNGSIILDTRDAKTFSQDFIKGSINIGLKGEFAPWVGTLIDIDKEIILVTEPGAEMEAITRLARIGYENVKGYLEGGFKTWSAAGLPVNFIENIEAEDFYFLNDNIEYTPIDVRRYAETKKEHIKRAIILPLEDLPKYFSEFDKEKNYVLFCKGGYRSMIAASILKSHGINNITNVSGGIEKIKICNPELIFA